MPKFSSAGLDAAFEVDTEPYEIDITDIECLVKLPPEANSFYGQSHTDETKQALSKFNKGKKLSQATKDKISLAGKGKKRSPETCKRISQAKLGKKRPEGFSETMSKAMKDNTSHLGFKHTEETKRRISEKKKAQHALRNNL